MVSVRNKILILILCITFFLVSCGRRDDVDQSSEIESDYVTATFHLEWEGSHNLYRAKSLLDDNHVFMDPNGYIDPNNLCKVKVWVYDESGELLRDAEFDYSKHKGTITQVKSGNNRRFVIEGKICTTENISYVVYMGEKIVNLTPNEKNDIGKITMKQDSECPQTPKISTNNDASNINSSSVNLSIQITDNCGIAAYLISTNPNDPDHNDPNWKMINWGDEKNYKEYKGSIDFTLSEKVGEKTVYLWFVDWAGNITERVSYTIFFKGITVHPTSGLVTTEAGGTASFSVVLEMQPEADVTIKILSNDETEGEVDPNSLDPNSCLIFTPDNWNISRDVKIIGVNDDIADGDVGYTINIEAAISADPEYNGLVPDPNYISLINWDNEGSYFEPDANTVALWHLNIDGNDDSGNDNDLEIKEDRVSWANGKYGRAAEMGTDPWEGSDCFNSDGGALTAPGAGCSYPGNGDWTVEAWVQFPSISKGYAIVYHYSEHLAGHEPYYLEISNGMAMFRIQDSSGNSETVSVDISNYANQWIHIACVYYYRQDLELYINKHLEEQVDTDLIPEVLTNYNVYLGGSYCGTSTGLKIDEVRISNIARYGDTDSDGMPDYWEIEYNLDTNYPNDANEDPDIDELINLDEYNHSTDPFNDDTDGDGFNDGDEALAGSNPNDPNDFPAPKRHYVDIDATGNEDGTSWNNAYKNLQDALAIAGRGDEIWVAEGIYKPDQGTGITPGDRDISFSLKDSVVIYGGFSGNETSRDQRDWLVHKTILSGDLNGDDDPNFSINDENSYHVVVGSDSDETAVLDGFVITSGNANGFDPADKGGGMYNYYGNPTITNCTFSENYANRGGGIYNDYSSPAINDCTFRENSANDAGGGIYNYNKSPIIANSTFLKNIARVGAGICNYSSNLEITDSTFDENFASSSGGGMYNTFSYSPPGNIWVSNCTFINNFAESYGGGMENSAGCNAIVDNCNFHNNKAWVGGGMMNSSESNIKVKNSNFYGNSASLHGGGMYNTNNTPILINCRFIKNSSYEKGGGIYHTITDSIITNCIFSKNIANYAGGVYIGGFDSKNEIINCTFHGNSVTGGAGGVLNQSSNMSLINCILWGNTAVSYGPQIGIIGGTISINYCDIQGGKDEIYQSDIIKWGIGNIDVDPLFVDPNGEDYHLQPGSPCIDAGDPNSAPPNFPDKDIDDESRPYGDHYDIGVDELTLIPPQNITIFPGDGRVTILWDAVPEAKDYNIYMAYSTDISKTNYIAKETVNTTYYTWTGLINGTICYFVLTSKNSVNKESYESYEIATTPNAQQNYYIFPEIGIDMAPIDVTIIGKGFQETPTISLYGGGPYIKGNCDTTDSAYGVFVSGNYAYVADYRSGLQVIDISDPSNLSIVGSCDTPDKAWDIYVTGSYAYVADIDSGLQVINISDPNNPSIVGSCDTPDNAKDVFVLGSYAYIADGGSGLQVIDISDPSNPSIVGLCDTPGNASGIFVSGAYAYVADWGSEFQVIDISDPSNPSIVGSCNPPGSGAAEGVYISGSYAYITSSSRMDIIDISDPINPGIVASCGNLFYSYEIFVSGSYAYVSDGGRGLQVIDIGDPSNLSIVNSYYTPGHAWGIFVSGAYAYVADSKSGLQLIDISNLSNPSIVNSHDMPYYACSVIVLGPYAYMADGVSGLQVIDISDPSNLTLVGSCDDIDITDGTNGISISGSYAYMSNEIYGLQVIDISDLSNPSIVGSCETPDDTYGIFVIGSYAYIADGGSGLQVIDINDPNNFRIVGSCDTPGSANGVFVIGSYAYIADGGSGLQIIDIKDLSNPITVGSCDTPDFAGDIYVLGSYAYVADRDSGLQIIDINDLSNPITVGSCDTPGYADGVFVSDNYAYVADGGLGLQVININDPKNPAIVGSCDTPGSAGGIYVTGSYAYVADCRSGLQVIEKYKPLNDITYIDSYIIKANIPADYRPGTYNLHITNPDGEHTVLYNVFTVYHLYHKIF